MNKFKAYKHITIKCTTDFSKNAMRSCEDKNMTQHGIPPTFCKLNSMRGCGFNLLVRIRPFIHQVKEFLYKAHVK